MRRPAQVIAQMDAYSLSKDDFDAIMEFQLLAPGATPDISAVPSAVKAALTRKYNQSHQAMSKVSGTRAISDRYTEQDDDGPDDDDDDEEDPADKLIQKAKPKGKPASKGKGKAKARG